MSTVRARPDVTLFLVDDDGPPLQSGADALELLMAAPPGEVLVVFPVARLDPAFFELRSGLAGDIAQKVVNYRMRAAFVGDISAHLDASKALRDFVRESNRGPHIWFADSLAALEARLDARR